ncbi:MAG TPA: ATP-binding protein, partial [Acidobacteriota bacterium]|nr:ATP-binding protein [Acidobacteriota bacterium]
VLYLPALFLLSIHIVWFLGWLGSVGLPRTTEVEYFLDRIELTHFLFFLGLAGFSLFWAWRATSSAVEQKQIQWVVAGTLAGVIPFALLYGVPYLLGLPIASLMEASVLSLCLIPLSFGYAITRYRLMDVDTIFRRGVAYLLASSALLGIYIGVALIIAQTVQGFSPESGFIFLALSALGVALLFAPLKEKIQEQIDRYFFKDQYSYRQSLASFGRALSSEFHLPSLTQKISDRIEKTLDLSPVAIYLREDPKSNVYRLYAIHGGADLFTADPVQVPEQFFLETRPFQQHLLPNDGTTDSNSEMPYSFAHIEPLRVRGRIIGFLGLGARSDRYLLSSEDLELVSGLADYAAIAIDNAILYGSLEAKAEELAALKTYNENVIESITLGVIAVSSDGSVTVWNSEMARITGVRSRDALGRNVVEILPSSLVASLREVAGTKNWLIAQPARLFKTHLKIADGESRLVNIYLAPVISHNDLNTATLMIVDDITEKVRLENQLLQAEKLSSIGLFAAGLAHEVNTPLAGISSYVQMLLEDTPPGDEKRPHLEKIEKQAFRASDIINNLLNFARFSDSDFEEINLNSLMMDTLSLLEHQLKKGNIDVHFKLDSTLPRTVGHAGKLQQVFMNLFLNAKDAMPNGGELDISTYQEDSEIIVEVHDTGMGISRDDIKKIYDPFFTTKEVGKGTGLGLSISYGIIQEHSGRIDVDSSPGRGTTFRLSLPVRRIH